MLLVDLDGAFILTPMAAMVPKLDADVLFAAAASPSEHGASLLILLSPSTFVIFNLAFLG